MLNRRNVVIVVLLGVLIALIYVYNYLFPEHRQISREEVKYELTVEELYAGMQDPDKRLYYEDQVIETWGEVTGFDQSLVTLESKIEINFTKPLVPEVNNGTQIRIKGRCVGFDDLLDRVKIDQAIRID